MIRKAAQYQIRREASADAEAAVREFIGAVMQAEPQTEYVALRLEDGVSYLHLMGFPSAEAEKRHHDAEYTRRFSERIRESCVAIPTFSQFEQILP